MNKKDYFNPVTHQVQDLSDLAPIQADKCFDIAKMDSLLGRELGKKIKRVILTGCGDSFSATGAMLPGFKKLSGIKKCNSPDIMDFCYYYTENKMTKGFSMDEVLVVAISFSGSAVRVAEALEKANRLGAHSLLITRTPDSLGGRAAAHVYNVETPDGCNSPGLRSYYASMVGLASLGAYLGLCNGTIDEKRFFEVKEAIVSYTLTFMEDFERIEDLMFAEALRMKDLKKFEVIGDGKEGYSAQFVEEKLIECGGVFCDHTTSEEFAHISFFHRVPSDFGTIVMIHEADPSMSRMVDTVRGCLAQHRPTLVVTDADPSLFHVLPETVPEILKDFPHSPLGANAMETAGEAVVCRIAKAPEPWMPPFVDFIPGSLLAGYQAAVREQMFFGGRYNFRTETWNRS